MLLRSLILFRPSSTRVSPDNAVTACEVDITSLSVLFAVVITTSIPSSSSSDSWAYNGNTNAESINIWNNFSKDFIFSPLLLI